MRSDDDTGEHLFEQLVKLSQPGQVPDRSDYYDEDDGWDLDGLRGDIQVMRAENAARV